ncbi:MAG TPA: D-aminoacyl-tRNA deacylase [Vicinamibacterales bacterium]|jgi:D-tyrosyl-tRNA(Tyr) deacylase
MRAVIQRVSSSRVTVEGQAVGGIGPGLLVLLGVTLSDTIEQARYLAGKVVGLRIFGDDEGKMNRSVVDVGGSILAVSQFTLYGDCRKGRRPSFDGAAPPAHAKALYEDFVGLLRESGVPVATGVFQAHMQVELVNDGPVTILLDTEHV